MKKRIKLKHSNFFGLAADVPFKPVISNPISMSRKRSLPLPGFGELTQARKELRLLMAARNKASKTRARQAPAKKLALAGKPQKKPAFKGARPRAMA